MKISSPAFKDGGSIPDLFTCKGKNINPPLDFFHIPENTRSLALVMEDPDVPKYVRSDGLWIHWLLWNIDPKTSQINQNSIPWGSVEGITTFGKPGYGGPCPPDGEHRYFFYLFALDKIIKLPNTATKKDLEELADGHILKKAVLMGRFSK